MNYVRANDVVSPKTRWQFISVLRDDGRGNTVFAVGVWDGRPVIGVRWNGDAENPIGNPQSRGLPTWFILPSYLNLAVLGTVDDNKQALAGELLGIQIPPVVDMQVDLHYGSGRHTLKVRESGQRRHADVLARNLSGNMNRLKFLEALYDEIRNHIDNGSRVVLHRLPSPDDP